MRLELQQTINHSAAENALPNPTEFDVALEEEERQQQQRDQGGDDYYASMEQQRQTELMHDQDEQLDGVFRTVGNLRQQASHMGRELEDQAIMIDEVDTLAERVGGKLSSGMTRIKHVVRQNEGKLEPKPEPEPESTSTFISASASAGRMWAVWESRVQS